MSLSSWTTNISLPLIISDLSQALPQEEFEDFGYDSESIDWYDYWINLLCRPCAAGLSAHRGRRPKPYFLEVLSFRRVWNHPLACPRPQYLPVTVASGNGILVSCGIRPAKRTAQESDPGDSFPASSSR
jgi:hypothetical protein